MAGTKISDATTTTPVFADMIPFARSADAAARHMTATALSTLFFDRAIVINESGADVDLRVEGSGEPNALFVQGSDGAVGIGTGTPDASLHVNGSFIVGCDGTPTELTIAGGVITVTNAFHIIDTQSDDATDDLVTINGGEYGMLLFLSSVDDDRNVVIKHADDNIMCNGSADITLEVSTDIAMFLYGADSKWYGLQIYND